MTSLALWDIVERACRFLGIITAAVLCAVGVETLNKTDFHSLAIYLLVSSAGMIIFEAAYYIDALLTKCFLCSPTYKLVIIWKKIDKIGGFQKFLYFTMMSVVCFLHPVLVWHATIPGFMLLLTGFSNFILSKRKNKVTMSSVDTSLPEVCITEKCQRTFNFFHIISTRGIIGSRLNSSSDRTQTILEPGISTHHDSRPKNKANKINRKFLESITQDDTELDDYSMDPEETTSDTAPMIRQKNVNVQ